MSYCTQLGLKKKIKKLEDITKLNFKADLYFLHVLALSRGSAEMFHNFTEILKALRCFAEKSSDKLNKKQRFLP